MVDEDLALRRREITGKTIQLCDHCGAPIVGDATVFEQAEFPVGQATEPIILCDDCRGAVQRGEIDIQQDPPEIEVPG